MTLSDFEQFIREAINNLPTEFASKLDNVEVLAKVWPSHDELKAAGTPPGSTLLGLYQGIPQTKRGSYTAVLPDKIILFAGPMLQITGGNEIRLKAQIRNTLLHEIGHHFGMSEIAIRDAIS